MKTDHWILLTALALFILGSIFNSKVLTFLGVIALLSELGYILIKTV